jgi:hypothetical protein
LSSLRYRSMKLGHQESRVETAISSSSWFTSSGGEPILVLW